MWWLKAAKLVFKYRWLILPAARYAYRKIKQKIQKKKNEKPTNKDR